MILVCLRNYLLLIVIEVYSHSVFQFYWIIFRWGLYKYLTIKY
jgi:hypothetical protein